MALLTFLILLESVVLLINIIVSVLLYFSNRTFLYKMALLFWLSFTLQYIVLPVCQQISVDIFYESYLGNGIFLLVTNTIMIKIIYHLLETEFVVKNHLLMGGIGLILSPLSYFMFGASFSVYSSIHIGFICCSAIFVVLKAFVGSNKKSVLLTTLVVVFLLVQTHYLNYPFLRIVSWFAPFGFTISIAIHVAFAIVLPSNLIKKISDDYASILEDRESELKQHRDNLEELVKKRTDELDAASDQLLVASRQAGMSEIVTGTLHNVGNVLNSVNISVSVIENYLERPIEGRLEQLKLLLEGSLYHPERLEKVPLYLEELVKFHREEKNKIKKESSFLRTKIDDIKNIISVQQSMAGFKGLIESISLKRLINDAIEVMQVSFKRHGITFEVIHHEDVMIETDRLKVLQILINLLTNAKNALKDSSRKNIIIETIKVNSDVSIKITDSGKGISAENLKQIFNYGFTTSQTGHGYGLHHSILSAQELGGMLSAYSSGVNLGAIFELSLPIEHASDKKAG